MNQMIHPIKFQRAYGEVEIEMTKRGLHRLYQRGSMKALRPRRQTEQAVLLNTAGGLTSGDAFSLAAKLDQGAHLVLTTQAAERVYACKENAANINNHIELKAGARIHWLPLETVFYNEAKLQRRLHIALAGDAEALLVESLVFGRHAMNETITALEISDRITLTRDGIPLVLDHFHLDDAALLQNPFALNSAQAISTVIYAHPKAYTMLNTARQALTGGHATARDGVLIARFMNPNARLNRHNLKHFLNHLTKGNLPITWNQ